MRIPALALIASAVLLSATAARAQSGGETVDLTITGGPNAGKWNASSTRGGCSVGLAGPGAWGNQLSSSDKDPKKFNSLQMIVPDAKKAATGTSEFNLSVGFGGLLNRSAEYVVDTRRDASRKVGSGTVTIADHGTTATVRFTATTADGVKLDGTIDCKAVTRG